MQAVSKLIQNKIRAPFLYQFHGVVEWQYKCRAYHIVKTVLYNIHPQLQSHFSRTLNQITFPLSNQLYIASTGSKCLLTLLFIYDYTFQPNGKTHNSDKAGYRIWILRLKWKIYKLQTPLKYMYKMHIYCYKCILNVKTIKTCIIETSPLHVQGFYICNNRVKQSLLS